MGSDDETESKNVKTLDPSKIKASGNNGAGGSGSSNQETRSIGKLIKECKQLEIKQLRPSGDLFKKASEAQAFLLRLKSGYRAIDLSDDNLKVKVYEQTDY